MITYLIIYFVIWFIISVLKIRSACESNLELLDMTEAFEISIISLFYPFSFLLLPYDTYKGWLWLKKNKPNWILAGIVLMLISAGLITVSYTVLKLI